MSDRDIFIERALPPDNTFAQALDALASVAVLIAVFGIAARSGIDVLVAVVVAVIALVWGYVVRNRELTSVISSVHHSMMAVYQVTDERLMILDSELNEDVFTAVKDLKWEPMTGLDLVRELSRVVPRTDLMVAMPALLATLEGEVSTKVSPDTEATA